MDGDDEVMKDGALLEEGRLLKEGLKLGFDEEEGRPEREGFNDGDFEGCGKVDANDTNIISHSSIIDTTYQRY